MLLCQMPGIPAAFGRLEDMDENQVFAFLDILPHVRNHDPAFASARAMQAMFR